MTRLVVAQSCWNAITFELDRVAPREGVVLPFISIETASDNPVAPIALADIITIAIAEVRCVPPELQHNSLLRVAALPRSDAWADTVVMPLVRRYPRLRTAAYLHSHPFAHATTWPSGGDIDGHMIPLYERNAEAGLFCAFSFIACGRWRLPCFAMTARRRVIELGNTEVIDDDDPIIRRARAMRGPRSAIRHWKRRMHARGLSPQIDELFGGWLRARVDLDSRDVLVALFPLDFPTTPARYFVVDRKSGATKPIESTELAA